MLDKTPTQESIPGKDSALSIGIECQYQLKNLLGNPTETQKFQGRPPMHRDKRLPEVNVGFIEWTLGLDEEYLVPSLHTCKTTMLILISMQFLTLSARFYTIKNSQYV